MSAFYELKQTFARVSPADRDRMLRALADDLRSRQRRWPRPVDLSGTSEHCALSIFPLFFADAFGDLDETRFVPFLAGCRLLAGSLLLADALYDEELDAGERRALLLRWHGMQFELDRAFAAAFAPDSPFWDALQAALAEHLRGIVRESSYTSGKRAIRDAAPRECIEIALAKNCVARVAVIGAALLGSDAARRASLLESLEHYHLARQIWDDLQDWKTDLRAKRATLVTRRLAPAVDLDTDLDLASAARELYYGGHADDLLEHARGSLAAALAAAGPEHRLPWHLLIEDLARSVDGLQRDLRTIVRRNVARQARRRASA